MAMDPNEELPHLTGFQEPDNWPDKLPEGVTKDPAVWYAHRRTYRNGRVVWEFYKRGAGGGPGQPDPIATTMETVNTKVQEDWKKEEDSRKPPGGATTKTVNGQVFQWNPETRAYDTPTGQAPTTTTGTSGQTTTIEGTPRPDGSWDNETPRKVTRYADGRPPTIAPLDATDMREWRENRERSRNPGGKTDAEIRADQDRARQEADRNKPGAPTLKPDGKGGTVAVQTMPDGSIRTTPLPNVPSDKPNPQTVTVNGQVYERDPQTGQYRPAQGLPAAPPDNPRTPGPTMPRIVRGMAQDAMREYGAALQAGVAQGHWSQKWADDRWAEYHQVAQLAVQEAATQQNERESARNAQYNTVVARNQSMQSAISDAGEFVSKLNGLLPAGSNLGGQAFAAMIGLKFLGMAASGLTGFNPQEYAPQPLTPADIQDPTQINQVVSAQLAQQQNAAAAEAERQRQLAQQNTTPPAAAQNAGAGGPTIYTTNPTSPAAPKPPSAAPVAGSGPAEPPSRANIPSAPPPQPDPSTLRRVAVNNAGADVMLAPDGTYWVKPQGEQWYRRVDAPPGTENQLGQPGDPGYGKPAPTKPDYGSPDLTVQPDPQMPIPVPYPTSPGLTSMAPPQPTGFAVLDNAMPRPPAAPQQQGPGNFAVLDMQPARRAAPIGGDHAVMLAEKVRNTPPWLLDPSEIEQAQQMGLSDDDVWGFPGRRVA